MSQFDPPTQEQAFQFAVLLQVGLPASDAIRYFVQDLPDDKVAKAAVEAWRQARPVKAAILKLMGKAWQDMSTQERMQKALDLHYSQLATLLFTQNYIEASPSDKTKMDTARTSLEAKLAGVAGKGTALDRFLEDLRDGKIANMPKSAQAFPGVVQPVQES